MDSAKEIRLLAAKTLHYFEYKDYKEIILNDLKEDESRTYSKAEMEAMDISKATTKTIQVDLKKYME